MLTLCNFVFFFMLCNHLEWSDGQQSAECAVSGLVRTTLKCSCSAMLAFIQNCCFDRIQGFNMEGVERAADLVEGQCLHVYVVCSTFRA